MSLELLELEIETIIEEILLEVENMPGTEWEKRKIFNKRVFKEIFKKIPIKNSLSSWGTNFKEVYREAIEPRILTVKGIQKYKDALQDLVTTTDFRLVFNNAGIRI